MAFLTFLKCLRSVIFRMIHTQSMHFKKNNVNFSTRMRHAYFIPFDAIYVYISFHKVLSRLNYSYMNVTKMYSFEKFGIK